MAEPSLYKFIDLYFDKVRSIYPDSFLSDENIKTILKNISSEAQLNSLFHFLSHALKTSPDKKTAGSLLFKHVETSEYELSQWIEAISFFKQWLDEHQRHSNFEKILGYIACCTSSPENKTLKFKLVDILKQMLNEHGFNG